MKIYGLELTEHTFCVHHASPLDIIAIKFKCCNSYYACYACHLALADHPPTRWSAEDTHIQAILCGRCKFELTIEEYRSCQSRCPSCGSSFNPKCQLHWDLYFSNDK